MNKLKVFLIPYPTENLNHHCVCPRGTLLVKEGLQQNPEEVELVELAEQADFCLLGYVPHYGGVRGNLEDILQYNSRKLIVVDWSDQDDNIFPKDYFVYFKRSWLTPSHRDNHLPCYVKYPRRGNPKDDHIFPIDYGILASFPVCRKELEQREIYISAPLRPSDPNRILVLNYLWNMKKVFPKETVGLSIGPVTSGSRSVGNDVFVDREYFDHLGNSRILVNCDPTFWFSGSRVYEGFASGALVFSDASYSHMADGFEDGVHFIRYNLNDLGDFRKKLFFYLDNPAEADIIRQAGQRFALAKHTSFARMSYVIKKVKELI